MKLNIEERLQMQMFLPQSGNLAEMGAAFSILKKVDFSKEEIEKYGIKKNGDTINWDMTKDEEINISFALSEKNLLIKTLNQKDAEGSLSIESVNFYNKIKQLENE